MRTLNAQQTAIIDSDTKTDVSWLFEIDRTGNASIDDYWSTKAKTWNAQPYTYKIMDFSPIQMERARSEYGVQAPSSFNFTVTNKASALTAADFAGGNVNVRLVVKAFVRKAVVTVTGGTKPTVGETMTGATSGETAVVLGPPDAWTGDVSVYFVSQSDAFHDDGEVVGFTGGGAGTIAVDLTWAQEEAEIILWNFDFVSVSPSYQTLRFDCRDWLTKYLDGTYPNTPLIHHLWPTLETGDYESCVPLIFGTAYIPITSAYITTDRYYIVGPAAPTYTYIEARSPDEAGVVTEWVPASTTFTESTKVGGDGLNYKVLQVIGMDSNGDSVADANAVFQSGGSYYPLSIKYSRDDLAAYTSPVDVIDYILQDMGVPSARIDATTKAAVKAIHASRGLTWSFGLYSQGDRRTLLANLCQNCGIELIARDKVYFKDHSNVSQKTIDASLILDKSFSYSWSHETGLQDSGYVLYRHVTGGIPEINLVKALIPAKVTTAVLSGITIVCSYVTSGSVHAQKLGIMALQRLLLATADVSFSAKGKLLALEADDMISMTGANYGGDYDCLIDSLSINKDLSVQLSTTRFSAALDDWDDLDPDAVVVGEDNTSPTYVMTPSIGVQVPAKGYHSGLQVTIKDATNLYVWGGSIDINGVMYVVVAQLTVPTGALSAGTLYYLYATAAGAGNTLSAGNFTLSTTGCTYDHAKGAEYMTGDGAKRFIAEVRAT